ncbi:MAG: hypothetical protein U0R44_02165 [Candidatus Micrarchaeia archaeon]
MVWIKNVSMKAAYICGECGLGFADARTALSCEGYCRAHRACSPEIARKAIYRP